jgi:hypothetical protein
MHKAGSSWYVHNDNAAAARTAHPQLCHQAGRF